jgi:hypothetical protein
LQYRMERTALIVLYKPGSGGRIAHRPG